jgi:hypothetical protein
MSKLTLAIAFATTVIGSTAFAEDISGTWKNIDDKTGSSKAIS